MRGSPLYGLWTPLSSRSYLKNSHFSLLGAILPGVGNYELRDGLTQGQASFVITAKMNARRQARIRCFLRQSSENSGFTGEEIPEDRRGPI